MHFLKLRALPAIVARVRRLFDLAANPAAIGEHLSKDPRLAPLVAALSTVLFYLITSQKIPATATKPSVKTSVLR
jgi:hypothetical protein